MHGDWRKRDETDDNAVASSAAAETAPDDVNTEPGMEKTRTVPSSTTSHRLRHWRKSVGLTAAPENCFQTKSELSYVLPALRGNQLTLWMMVGFPHTGKDEWIKEQVAMGSFPSDTVFLSTDDWIEAEAAKEGVTYNDIFRRPGAFDKACKAMETKAREAVVARACVVWNQTNLSVYSRQQKLAMFRGYFKNAVHIACPDDETWAAMRARRPDKVIDPNELKNMRRRYCAPTTEEGFNAIIEVPAATLAAASSV
jgi:predicted kinase